MAEKKKEPKQHKPYEIIRRKNIGAYRVTTFMAPGLPQWPVFIKKKEWSLEEENEQILERIENLKRHIKQRMRGYYPELTKTQYRILISLAMQGPARSRSALAKRKIKTEDEEAEDNQPPKDGKPVGDDETVRRNLDFLESQYLIQSRKSPREGESKFIELTTAGLFRLLGSDWPELWQHFDKIAKTNKAKVSLIFGNWEKFIKDGTADNFKEGILNYFKNPAQSNTTVYDLLVHKKPTKLSEKILADDLTRHVLLPQLFPYIYQMFLPEYTAASFESAIDSSPAPPMSRDYIISWFRTVSCYPKLKVYLLKELYRLEQESASFSNTIREWISILENPTAVKKRPIKGWVNDQDGATS